ncbi:MAG: Holliday junction resolvase RuvX [Actinomycetota bacterium]|nr:Holliday junction resolvase RuvX [Actinomycetota bacterium]
MRSGVRLACDVGTVRIGLARSDASGLLAVPLPAVKAGAGALGAVVAAVDEWEAIEVVIGLPLHMSGHEGTSAELARQFASGLAERVAAPVRLLDERFSTVQAQRGLHASGRTTRQSRSLIDSASAVIVLQAALDAERAAGNGGHA